jgi:hypothetical protein
MEVFDRTTARQPATQSYERGGAGAFKPDKPTRLGIQSRAIGAAGAVEAEVTAGKGINPGAAGRDFDSGPLEFEFVDRDLGGSASTPTIR